MPKATLAQIIAALPTALTVEASPHNREDDGWATVTNAEGDRFSLYVNSYRGKATAQVSGYDVDTVRANASDISSDLRADDASSSLDGDPAKIAASLARRVFNDPAHIAEARAIRAVFDQRTASRAGLRQGIAALQGQGYRCSELRDGEDVPMYKYDCVTLYKPGQPVIRLYGNGRITFDTSISTDMENLQFVLDTLAQIKGE